jgi:folate-binding protein YgfZ
VSIVTTFAADYVAVTEGCGLLDRSERGKLALSGSDARAFLHGQVTNDTESLAAGEGCYAAFLTNKGKMLGDLRVLDTGDELLLDTERPALQELFNMIRRYSVGHQVELQKRTLESGLLSLIGPQSDAVAEAAAAAIPGAEDHAHVAATIGATAARLIRTDVGIDVLCASEELEGVRVALRQAGAAEIGVDAAECLRVERGRPRYGIDLDETVIPQEAGLNERAVSFRKGCYVGQETVARLYYKGKPNRELRGLRSDEPIAVGTELRLQDRVVGTVTSSVVSPRFGAIALALVRREAPVGSSVEAGSADVAEVVALPFG